MIKAGLLSETQTPRERVFQEISDRLTSGLQDESVAMRVDLYLGDVFDAVEKDPKKPEVELLREVKESSGFGTLDSVVNVPDQTTLDLIKEVKQKLQEIG